MTKREALEALILEIQIGLRSGIAPKEIIKSQIATGAPEGLVRKLVELAVRYNSIGAPESLVRKMVELAVRYNAIEDEITLIGLNAKKP